MRNREAAAKAHHFCGLLVLAGVMLWLVAEIVVKLAEEIARAS